MDDKRKERINYYKRIARSKGFRQETIEMGWMLACSQELVEKFGGIDAAFEEIIKICEKHDNGEKFIAEVTDLLDIK